MMRDSIYLIELLNFLNRPLFWLLANRLVIPKGLFIYCWRGGDGSKVGGSTKIIWGKRGGVRKILHLERGVCENKIGEIIGGVYENQIVIS